jgi:putative endopeptidase
MTQSPRLFSKHLNHVGNFIFAGGLCLLMGVAPSFANPCKGDSCKNKAEMTPIPAVDKSALDPTTEPCQDFYQYACGGWIAKTEIPEDRPQWSRGFAEIDERNMKLLRTVLTDYSVGKNPPKNPYRSQLGDYYEVCTDEAKAETASMDTLKGWIEQIDALKSKDELFSLVAKLHMIGVNAFFDFGAEQDLKDPSSMIGTVDQAGLGLPDRDYYLKNDAKMLEVQKLYQEHLKKMFALLGKTEPEVTQASTHIYQIEKALAESSTDRVERRDPAKIYHRLEKAGLEKLSPELNWNQYFASLGYPKVDAINVKSPAFFSDLNKLVVAMSLVDLKTYLQWHLLHSSSSALGKQFVDQEFQFYAKTLSGQKALAPRWKRCVQATVGSMSFAVGRSFVDLSFGKNGKAISKKMIADIENAFRANLDQTKWMDAPTRAEAIRKLDRIFNKVGYPDHWRSYKGLKVDRKSYLKNRFSATFFNSQYELDKIGKPVDRGEWQMPPSMVNAYYDPSMNEMVFPAGILQDPFFDANASSPANYAGIGMVMGHELTHGFDDEGRKFNADGKLQDWWSPEVSKEFDKRAECVVKQYDSYEVADGLHVNGKLTAGENLADLGGIKTSYAAWQKTNEGSVSIPKMEQASSAVSSTNKDTHNEKQQFFIHFAQTWCTKTKPEFERMKITVDPHSPPKMRVNGPLADFSEFATTFSCAAGTPMNPVNRCIVW